MKYYAIRTKNGKYIGIDQGSGGYPWEAGDSPLDMSVHRWNDYNFKNLKEYLKVCKYEVEREGWEVVEITFNVKPVKL